MRWNEKSKVPQGAYRDKSLGCYSLEVRGASPFVLTYRPTLRVDWAGSSCRERQRVSISCVRRGTALFAADAGPQADERC
jgi:hypothetical protein